MYCLENVTALMMVLLMVIFVSTPGTEGNTQVYGYDASLGACRSFQYTGCGGNTNRFIVKQNCDNTCGNFYCPPGYKVYEGDKSCLYFYEQKSYDDARRTCQRKGEDLVQVKDSNKEEFLMVMYAVLDVYWMGLRLSNPNTQTFTYNDGTQVGDFHPWGPDQPDNRRGNESCVVASRTNHQALWSDVPCTERYQFVCQVKAKVPDKCALPIDEGACEVVADLPLPAPEDQNPKVKGVYKHIHLKLYWHKK